MLIEPDRGHQTGTMRIKIDRGVEPLEPFSQPQSQASSRCGQNCDGWITNITSAPGAILRLHKARLYQAPTSAPLVVTVQPDFRTALSGILLGVPPYYHPNLSGSHATKCRLSVRACKGKRRVRRNRFGMPLISNVPREAYVKIQRNKISISFTNMINDYREI
jgi:hypothetical protein